MNPETNPEQIKQLSAEQLVPISERHQASLRRTMRIADMVRGEDEMGNNEEVDWNGPLEVSVVESTDDIPHKEGVYLIDGEVDTEGHEDIMGTEFTFSPNILSGKVDSAHAVLPGTLAVSYSDDPNERTELPVAAKGFYKRNFSEKLERVKNEVAISKIQEEKGEIAFSPVAIVIAPPPYEGKHTDHDDYDVLLVTRLDEKVASLDNAPWQLGFNEDNLSLAEDAVNALGSFNTEVGLHGDAKIKNVAQKPDGQVGMIDFETSQVLDRNDPARASEIVLEDLNTLFDSLEKRGFFERQPRRTHEVLSALAETYLQHWSDYDSDVQEAVFEQASNAAEKYLGYKQNFAVAA